MALGLGCTLACHMLHACTRTNVAADERALRECHCELNEAIVADAIAEKSKVPQESKHALRAGMEGHGLAAAEVVCSDSGGCEPACQALESRFSACAQTP